LRPFRDDAQRLGFINQSDPSQSFVLIMLVLLALNVFRGGNHIPPAKQIIAVLASFIIATTIHEFCHAFTALKLGDDTARQLGRLTFDPVAHFEPYGFFGMVMISLGFNFIGWGKPVPVQVHRLRGRTPAAKNRALGLVAVAGPVSNLLQAGIVAGVLRLLLHQNANLGQIPYYAEWFIYVNLLLAAFNMIPLPPLDGHKILTALLPGFWHPVLYSLNRFGFMIIFVLFFATSWLGLPSITNDMISPPLQLFSRAINFISG
jgi:Zn-dependent protease